MTVNLSLKKNIIWNSIGNLVYWGSSWLITILVVRLGNYRLAGILSIAMSISSTIYCISAYGVYNYQVSDIKQEYSKNCYFTARILTSAIGLILCIVFCYFNNYSSYQSICIICYMLYKTIESIVNVIQAEEQKANHMDFVGVAYIIRGLGSLIIFTLTMYFVTNLFIAILLMTIYSLLVLFFYDFPVIKKNLNIFYKIDFYNVKKLLIVCLPMALYWLFNTLTPTIPKLGIQSILGEIQLGYYASISSPLLVISMCINFVLTPLISPLAINYENNKYIEFKVLFIKILFGIILFGVICMLGGELTLDIFLNILYGNTILKYREVAQVMIFVVILSSIIAFLNIIITVFRKLWLLVLLNGMTSLICILINEKIIQSYGIQGANYILIFSYILQIFISLLVVLNNYLNWKKRRENNV